MSGRPPKYTLKHCDMLIEQMSDGKLDVQIYATWDICKDTFIEWKKTHPEFLAAYKIGFAKCEAWWIDKMRECWLRGDDKGFKYCIAIMNNKFGWGKDENKVANNTQININNMNLLTADKSNSELLEVLNQKLETLRLPVIDAKVIEHSPDEDMHE